MNKTKKMLAWMLLAAMPMAGNAAQAETMSRAAEVLEIRDLERYPSYFCDGATGKWSVRANAADALLDRFWTYGAESGSALCVFNLELEGSAQTDIWTPVLRFYLMNGKKINARAVSLLADGTRYDFAASSGEVASGGYAAQCISVPLGEEALSALRAIAGSEAVSVRLIGDNVHTAKLNRSSTNSKGKVEAASLGGLEVAFALLEDVGVDGYALWDLSADAWESEYGYAPAFYQSELVKEVGGETVSDDFGMVMRSDQTRAARAAQEVLIEGGFLFGPATGTFGKNAVSATLRAQHYLGVIETGCMDAQLEKALLEGVAGDRAAAEAATTRLGDAAEIALNRCWFANGVSAAHAPSGARTVSNGDNLFLIADGWIRNISGQELWLFTEVKARVLYGDGCAYEATVSCERDEGCELDVTMLPMAEARLVVYAEVPAQLARDAQAQWRVELSANGQSVEYALQ